jgi:2-methylcitrate dehydratase PrpD
VIVDGLAGAVAATSWADSPAAVRDRVADLVADCVAVSALGSGRPELVRLVEAQAATPEGRATVVGSARGWPSSTAAFLNASAAAADQLQDGHRLARGHPASHVVPPVLALAEERDLDGSEVLSAVLAGYEAGVRIGCAMGGTPDGVHDIGTWGQVAVSAAVARLLAPGDAGAARRAIELSAAAVLLTDAATVFAGRTGSHVFLGASVQLGTSLATAAVAGLEPEAGSLDRHLGTVAARAWDPAALATGGGWDDWEVLGGYVKRHPTCAHLHGINDAVADLLDRGVHGRDVRDVEVRASAGAAAFAAVADGELAARFSVPTSVAVALLTGRLDETTMNDDVVTAADVVDLARRVRVVHDPSLDEGYPAGRPARVRVTLGDGSERTASADRPRGDADRAFSRAELAGKADRLLASRFGDAGRDVLTAVHALAAGGGARDVGTALRRAAGGLR